MFILFWTTNSDPDRLCYERFETDHAVSKRYHELIRTEPDLFLAGWREVREPPEWIADVLQRLAFFGACVLGCVVYVLAR